MTIRNQEAFNNSLSAGFDGVFDWDFLVRAGCFYGNIQPMDVDAWVERHKRYLLFETKAPMKEVPQGQRWALERLRNAKSVTVIYIWGKTFTEITKYEIFTSKGQHIEYNGKDAAQKLIEYVDGWSKWAEKDY